MEPCSTQFSVTFISMVVKCNLGRGRVHFILYFQGTALLWGKSGRNVEAGTVAEGLEEDCSPVHLLVHTVAFPVPLRATCLGMAPPAVGWALLHQSATRKIPHRPSEHTRFFS